MKNVLKILVLLFVVAVSALPQTSSVSYIIDTVAGTDVLSGTGQAIDAWFSPPAGVTTDASGNVYVADREEHRILRVSPDGTVERFAGTGSVRNSGDGGPATEAGLVGPSGMAVGPDGSLYVCSSRGLVRKIGLDGIITTVAGTNQGFAGDGGPAVQARLRGPTGVALDDYGNLYIADQGNFRIRLVSADGIISTVAGNGTQGFAGDGGPASSAQLARPSDVAIGPDGRLYIADLGNSADSSRIRRVDHEGMISTIVASESSTGTSLLTPQGFSAPAGLAFGAGGNLYVVSSYQVLSVNLDALTSQTVAGDGEMGFSGDGGPAAEARLNGAMAVAVHGGTVYIADTQNRRIRSVTAGTIQTVAGREHFSGDGGLATAATLDGPQGVAVDDAGNLYIADTRNNAVRHVTPEGMISTIVGDGEPGFAGDGGPSASAKVSWPWDVLVGKDGDLFISDFSNNRIRRIDSSGTINPFGGNGGFVEGPDNIPATEAGLIAPQGFAMDAQGNLIVAVNGTSKVRSISPTGIISTLAGTGNVGFSGDGGPAELAQLFWPGYVEADGQGRVYISDVQNTRIRMVNLDGTIETIAGGGTEDVEDGSPALNVSLLLTGGLTFDPNGSLIFALTSRSQIARLEPDGTLSIVAGRSGFDFGSAPGLDGDGGPATEARLGFPEGITSDQEGNIYVADRRNNRIRKLTPVVTRINTGGVVNAASIAFSSAVDTVSPDSIISIFGVGLSFVTDGATTLPLPTELGGVTVEITDSQGATHQGRLFAVTPNQINCLVPAETALGPATLRVRNVAGVSTIEVEVVALAPGLFAINGGGEGLAAATAFRRDANLMDTPLPVFDAMAFPFQAHPIDLGGETDLVVLSLYGTGIRSYQNSIEVTIGGEAAQFLGAAPSARFAGLDQINVVIPRSLIGRGVVEIRVTVDGLLLNVVTITIL